MRRRLLIFAGVVGALLVLVIAAVLILTQTRFGHERLRRYTLGLLNDVAHGTVRVGSVSGNLLDGVTLTDVSITDSTGAPFLSADTIEAKYRLASFLSKRIALSGLRLVHPVFVFERREGEEWNFKRIFPGDTTPAKDDGPGFGDWVSFNDVTIVDGRVLVRSPWQPAATLAGARDSAVAAALGGETRVHVERAPHGVRKVMDFRELNANLPRLRINDPDTSGVAIQVARLRGIAEPFRPPAAEVRDLAGTFFIVDDTLSFRGARVALPGSRITGDGTYALASKELRLALRGAPVAIADLRWLYPRLPSSGSGSLDFRTILRDEGEDVYAATNADIRLGNASLTGDLGLTMGDTARLHNTDLRFARIDTRLIEQLVPSLEVPRRGTLSGRAAVEGTIAALRVNGDVTFADGRDGVSRVVAAGEMGFAQDFSARDLRLRLEPARMELVELVTGELPIGGAISGRLTLDGSTRTRFAARGDLVHNDGGARSHVTGRATIALGAHSWLDVDLHADPVALATVGRFAPGLGLQGSATGPIRLRGSLGDLAVLIDLRLPDGGELDARGRLDLAGRERGYDLDANLRVMNLNAVVAKAPRTSLTAAVSAEGRGLDPATMTATFTADITNSALDSIAFDSARVRVAIAGGMATVDSFTLSTASASANIAGTFGLAAGREGALSYLLDIDSLSALSRWLPVKDSGTVAPRPARVKEALVKARADSVKLAEATEVERAVTGAPAPTLQMDSIATVRRDSLAGSLYTVGSVRGNLTRFDVRGRAALSDVVVRGNSVRHGRVEYSWLNARTPAPTMLIAVSLDSVQAAGFALDSVEGRVSYQSTRGTVELAIRQDEKQDYALRADFALHLDHREAHFNRLRLRFDTTQWASTRPGTVRWGKRGIEIETFELTSGDKGRIYVNGLLPTEGVANLEVAVEGLQISHLVDLLQGDLEATGVLSLAGRAQGTLGDPRFRGAAAVTQPSFRGTPLPDIRARFEYADAQLVARAELLRGTGDPLAVAEGTLPVNLAMGGYDGPRLLDRPLEFELRADSLPLDVLPKLTDAISDVRGRLVGVISARGMTKHPQLAGVVALDLASFRVVPLGVTIRDITGAVKLLGDSLVIDSLVGRSGGRVQVRGSVDVSSIAKPGFALQVLAANALVFDTENGRARADMNIDVNGPFDAVYVTGHVNVRNGVLYVKEPEGKKIINTGDPAVFSIIDTSVIAEREVVPAQSPLLKNLRVDVDLHVSRDTWVRSPDANVEIYTQETFGDLAIHVDRGKQALALEGVVNTDRGEYSFLGRRFIISRGSATFMKDAEINPLLQIIGAHEVQLPNREALEIRVVIGGTLRHPRLTMESSSQPPMSQSDLLSYLAFGRSSSSLLQLQGSGLSGESGEGGQLVGSVAALATRQLTGIALDALAHDFEANAARSLGTDVFNVSPADVPAEISQRKVVSSLSLTEVEAGKYVSTRTFVAVRARPALVAPGARLEHRMNRGLRFELSFAPRYLLREPTLSEQKPAQIGVFGAFLIREWRF